MEEYQQDPMITLALTISYNGQPFCGYAKQPGQLTVQGSLEEALKLIFRRPIETVCSGRTDSGVHARGQVVSFSIPEFVWENRSEQKILRSLNALTHESIAVKKIEKKELDFSARFSAVSREYRYFISTDSYASLLMQDFSWQLGKKLDIEAMRKAAKYLIGEHDFKSFCLAVSAEGKPTHRYVASLTVEPYEVWGENLVCITILGNAFLHSMVRTIVGTLVMVGLGKREPEWVKEVLEARNRGAAGENAPAQGLVFWKVNYTGKRYYDPSEKKAHEEKKRLLKQEKKKSVLASHLALSDVLAEYLPHRGAETEFVIPRGDGQPISGAAFSDIKMPTSAPETPLSTNGSLSDGAAISTEPVWTPGPRKTTDEISIGEKASSPEETGKLPLTLSAWDTGKLEPVAVANFEEHIFTSLKNNPAGQRDFSEEGNDSLKIDREAKLAPSNISAPAIDESQEPEQMDDQVILKRVYPFQQK